MLTVVPPALDGLHPTKKGSAWLRVQKFRGSFDVVHFRYGPSVPFPQHSTPPRGDAVEFMFRREQSNSTGGTFTHVETSFTGAGFVAFCRLFREAGGRRMPTEANKGNEEFAQGQKGESGSIGREISEYMRFPDTFSPNAQQSALCEDSCPAPA